MSIISSGITPNKIKDAYDIGANKEAEKMRKSSLTLERFLTWSGKQKSSKDCHLNTSELNRTQSTNILCKGENGSSAYVVIPASQAQWFSKGESTKTISTACCSNSSSNIPVINTVASFDEYMTMSEKGSIMWSLQKILDKISAGLC